MTGKIYYGFGIQTNELRTYFPSNAGFMTFGTISTADGTTFAEKMRITKDGYVGIGTASPNYPLQVIGTINTTQLSADNKNVSFKMMMIFSSALMGQL